jgi:hypothetical protein
MSERSAGEELVFGCLAWCVVWGGLVLAVVIGYVRLSG